MKIAQISCAFPPYNGGIGNVAYHYSKLLAGRGHDLTVYTLKQGSDRAKFENNKLNIIYNDPFIRMGLGAVLPQLLYVLRGFDIVQLHYPFYGVNEILWLAKRITNRKMKLAIHFHMDVDQSGPVHRLLAAPSRFTANNLFRTAELITCSSRDYAENSGLSNIYKSDPEKFAFIPFGVDSDLFFPAKQKNTQTKPNLLFVGGLDKAHYFKGLDTLLRAAQNIINQIGGITIVGDGDLRPYYEKVCQDLGISDKVTFAGSVPEAALSARYRSADIFILPSINRNEAFGLVLLEAMASGLPVIASRLPGVREVFRDGEQGFYVKPNSINDLSAALAKLCQDASLRSFMGENGRKLVLKLYDWEKIGIRLEKSLLKCAERKP